MNYIAQTQEMKLSFEQIYDLKLIKAHNTRRKTRLESEHIWFLAVIFCLSNGRALPFFCFEFRIEQNIYTSLFSGRKYCQKPMTLIGTMLCIIKQFQNLRHCDVAKVVWNLRGNPGLIAFQYYRSAHIVFVGIFSQWGLYSGFYERFVKNILFGIL